MTKNITLSADEALIERARERARKQQTSLNAAFREWLEAYAARADARVEYQRLMADLDGVRSGRTFSRDELNER